MSGRGLAIVSAADARFFELLRNLVRSIRRQARGCDAALHVLDVGLSQEQREELAQLGVVLETARNDFGVKITDGMPPHVLALLSRAWLPEYFPGFDAYLWIDADAELQDWRSVELYVEGARRGALAITPEADRAYALPRIKLRLGRPWKIKHWLYERSRNVYSREDVQLLANRNVLNCGVFALARDAPHWDAWRESFDAALARGHHARWIEGGDQLSLCHAVYTRDLPVELLPAWCNWSCIHALPAVDPETGLLVEPYLPHAVLSIVHAVGMTAEQATQPRSLVALDGSRVERPLLGVSKA